LLGVQQTVPLVATASRFTPVGFALNGIQSLRGKKGSMTGSVQAALEVNDSQSGELLFAAVRRRSPVALDIESTLSTEKTVEAVADEFAKAIRKGIDTANGR
jgi:phosphopantetheinyl transferase